MYILLFWCFFVTSKDSKHGRRSTWNREKEHRCGFLFPAYSNRHRLRRRWILFSEIQIHVGQDPQQSRIDHQERTSLSPERTRSHCLDDFHDRYCEFSIAIAIY